MTTAMILVCRAAGLLFLICELLVLRKPHPQARLLLQCQWRTRPLLRSKAAALTLLPIFSI
jgi:hypothetical protein